MTAHLASRIARLFASILLGTALPLSFVSAATSQIITNWQDPAPYSFYSYQSPVIITGSYTLPPDWVGTIYVHQDTDPTDPNPPSIGRLYIDNSGGATPRTGTFTIDLGIQPATPSPHSIYIEFFGGQTCIFTVPATCQRVAGNWADQNYTPRTYTASNTPDPVISISYDANGAQPIQSPAYNFANVPVLTTDTRTLYVRNVGGGTANGSVTIAGGTNPFYVTGGSPFSVPAGAAVPVQVQFAPSVANVSSSAVLAFDCTSPNCADVNANLTGNSVPSAIPPVADLSDNYLSFGTVNVGSYEDRTITITNTGGGVLTGTLTFDDPAFTCLPNCNYAITSGSSYTITIRFTPTTNGWVSATMSVPGGPSIETVSLEGAGNTEPIIDINCVACDGVGSGTQYHWDIPNPVAPGQTLYQTVEVSNIGVGVLSGQVAPTPGPWNGLGWHCISVTQNGVTTSFSDASPCTYSGLVRGGPPAIVQFEFTASAANVGPLYSTVGFDNTGYPNHTSTLELSATVTTDPMLQITNLPGELWFMDALINRTETQTIELSNVGTNPLTVVINLPPGDGVFTCANALECNTPIVLPAAGSPGSTVNVTFRFTPLEPRGYVQPFTVCVLASCGSYTMHGQGQDPRLGYYSVVPGGENTDTKIVCAQQGDICVFSGTRTVYYGLGSSVVQRPFTGSARCDSATFGGDPAPGLVKFCWIDNPDGGTWITAARRWTSAAVIHLYNAGIGGTVRYQITGSSNFICSSTRSCQGSGTLTNSDEHDWTFDRDVDNRFIYFNPTAAGLVTQDIMITYDLVALLNNSTPDCNYCHSQPIAMRGTGLAGPHLSYSMAAFPITNVGSNSGADLTIASDGTDPALNVEVSSVTGQFSCSANCGPYDIPPGSTQIARITFTPLSAGAKSGVANVTSSAAALAVPLSGTGNISPILGILPVTGFIDYGTVNQGSQMVSGTGSVPPIIVTNTGAGLLTGDATPATGTHYVCISCHYEALAPGDTRELKVAFVPKNVGPLNDVLNFTGGGGGSINLFGVGALGASSITSDDADFGRVVLRAGAYREKVITIYNEGSVDLTGGEVILSGPYACVPPSPINPVTGRCTYANIPAGGSVQFTIRFTPTTPGVSNGVLLLGGSSNARVRLSGSAVVPSVKFIER